MSSLSFRTTWHYRRDVRFTAASLGLKVQEFKGWFDSGFVVEGDPAAVTQMFEWLQAQATTP